MATTSPAYTPLRQAGARRGAPPSFGTPSSSYVSPASAASMQVVSPMTPFTPSVPPTTPTRRGGAATRSPRTPYRVGSLEESASLPQSLLQSPATAVIEPPSAPANIAEAARRVGGNVAKKPPAKKVIFVEQQKIAALRRLRAAAEAEARGSGSPQHTFELGSLGSCSALTLPDATLATPAAHTANDFHAPEAVVFSPRRQPMAAPAARVDTDDSLFGSDDDVPPLPPAAPMPTSSGAAGTSPGEVARSKFSQAAAMHMYRKARGKGTRWTALVKAARHLAERPSIGTLAAGASEEDQERTAEAMKNWAAKLVSQGVVRTQGDVRTQRKTSYAEAGDVAHYTKDAVVKRLSLQHSDAVRSAIRMLWAVLPKTSASRLAIAKETYVKVFSCIGETILQQDISRKQLLMDWDYDMARAREQGGAGKPPTPPSGRRMSKTGGAIQSMGKDAFTSATFDMIDTWTANTSEQTYARIARRCAEVVYDRCYPDAFRVCVNGEWHRLTLDDVLVVEDAAMNGTVATATIVIPGVGECVVDLQTGMWRAVDGSASGRVECGHYKTETLRVEAQAETPTQPDTPPLVMIPSGRAQGADTLNAEGLSSADSATDTTSWGKTTPTDAVSAGAAPPVMRPPRPLTGVSESCRRAIAQARAKYQARKVEDSGLRPAHFDLSIVAAGGGRASPSTPPPPPQQQQQDCFTPSLHSSRPHDAGGGIFASGDGFDASAAGGFAAARASPGLLTEDIDVADDAEVAAVAAADAARAAAALQQGRPGSATAHRSDTPLVTAIPIDAGVPFGADVTRHLHTPVPMVPASGTFTPALMPLLAGQDGDGRGGDQGAPSPPGSAMHTPVVLTGVEPAFPSPPRAGGTVVSSRWLGKAPTELCCSVHHVKAEDKAREKVKAMPCELRRLCKKTNAGWGTMSWVERWRVVSKFKTAFEHVQAKDEQKQLQEAGDAVPPLGEVHPYFSSLPTLPGAPPPLLPAACVPGGPVVDPRPDTLDLRLQRLRSTLAAPGASSQQRHRSAIAGGRTASTSMPRQEMGGTLSASAVMSLLTFESDATRGARHAAVCAALTAFVLVGGAPRPRAPSHDEGTLAVVLAASPDVFGLDVHVTEELVEVHRPQVTPAPPGWCAFSDPTADDDDGVDTLDGSNAAAAAVVSPPHAPGTAGAGGARPSELVTLDPPPLKVDFIRAPQDPNVPPYWLVLNKAPPFPTDRALDPKVYTCEDAYKTLYRMMLKPSKPQQQQQQQNAAAAGVYAAGAGYGRRRRGSAQVQKAATARPVRPTADDVIPPLRWRTGAQSRHRKCTVLRR